MIRLGITGGIGCGKSTVAQLLRHYCNGILLDADAISRQTTAPGGSAIAEITRRWGKEVLAPNGSLNRPLVRQWAFENPPFRRDLESIIHPLVYQEMERIEQECMRQQMPALIFDIPLLIESGHWRPRLHQILVVDCSEETQVQRVHARSQIEHKDVRVIIQAQVHRALRLKAADIVISNDGISLPELEKQCEQVSTILVSQKLGKDSA